MKNLGIMLFSVAFAFSCKAESDTVDYCGNGYVDMSEACDKDNLAGQYCQLLGYHGGRLACTDECQFDESNCIEAGFCGDGKIQSDKEACDGDSSILNNSCSVIGYSGGNLACTEDCRYNISDCEGAENCGNGTIEAPELCDGENLNGFTCSGLEGFSGGNLFCGSDCRFDTSGCFSQPQCDDGKVEGAEQCDSSNLQGQNCESLGLISGKLNCTPECTFDVSGCEGEESCGDGILQLNEQCDQSEFGDQKCISLGFYGGKLNCTDSCKLDTSQCEAYGRCGDAVVQEVYNEQCDGGELNGATCADFDYYGGNLFCKTNCRFDFSDCENAGICGDNLIQSQEGETCDGTNFVGETCENAGHTYGGELTCVDCTTIDFSSCSGSCGDNLLQTQEGETCDGTNFAGETCQGLGYMHGGVLTCNNECMGISTEFCHVFQQISAGSTNSCGLTLSGTIYCWGDGSDGALGDGQNDDSGIPVLVIGGHSFDAISTGNFYSCAIATGGEVYCWGSNYYGQLGDGTTNNSLQPQPIIGNYSFQSIAAGVYHTCGVTDSGAVYCWGINSYGQLGDGTNNDSPIPVLIDGNHQFQSISTGNNHTCAITDLGVAYCWGLNDVYGRLGDGSGVNSTVPVMVSGNYTFQQISAGVYHSCGVTDSGTAYCWGRNSDGQLGDGTTTVSSTPIPVSSGYTFQNISTGNYHSCGVTDSGAAYCWGSNSDGQLGDGTTTSSATPVPVSGNITFQSIVSGSFYNCGVSDVGSAYCWGSNDNGQLGDSTTNNSLAPVLVTDF
ncbi:MAG: hypothetical protein PF689_06310 [Deltaproteobacteria bacterium]|jgi:alpha-tubulin suppressor-like RCC1 family protein|nr:hypothetical protein [Deltaproteobacteria bacterium]